MIPIRRIGKMRFNGRKNEEYCSLFRKTPLPNGSNFITLPQEEFDRVVEFLLEGRNV